MATLILNPWSGGGKYQPAIRVAAERCGWVIREVGPGADPGGLAASSDTDVLVVAGGDGTVSAVAAVAVERDLPLVVLPCGTLNHFAADAGLDCTDPLTGVAAVENGTELRVDVGSVNGRVFINNASIGFYSSMVQDPQYRSRRVAVTSRYLRRAIRGGGTTMTVWLTLAPRVVVPDHVLTILVSNNAYSPGVAPGAALRPRLDEAVLWVHLLGLDERRGPLVWRFAQTLVTLLSGRSQVAAWPTREQTVGFDRARVRVGLDGEAVELTTPLRFSSRPGALRLRIPSAVETREVRIQMQA
jgi:diacylglycerol kinase family enzyme